MNMKSPVVVITAAVIVMVLLFGAWQFMQGQNATNQSPTTVSPTPEAMIEEDKTIADEMTVTLEEQNASGESGTATITEENGYAVVNIDVTGFQPSAQPAHIHVGSCPKPGEVKYPLTDVVDGKSTTTLDVPLSQIKTELPLAINVHKSTDEVTVYTSCGDLPSQ